MPLALVSSPISLAGPKKIVSAETVLNDLGVIPRHAETLPFVEDATAGSETELHAAVIGARADVDLPISIEESNYFANAARRAEAGDTPRHILSRLENWLDEPDDRIWDDSWVRVPLRLLSPTARQILHQDLLADKSDPNSSRRGDHQRFFCRHRGEERFRGPMSYLLKLALADILDGAPMPILEAGKRVMSKFINDNTSPETISFRVVDLRRGNGFGRALSAETASRFLFSQVLTAWANDRFELAADGQKAVLYSSPHPPVRQRRLNDSISDAFYRELFMSPCLSGWDRGESKRDYMALCHQTLSRSQLNAVGKLREAGVITRNLVVLPNTSHVGLANNGTHVSLGSTLLSRSVAADGAFGPTEEKLVGDLAIKVVEHFLPLFVGAYSAAPYRLDFEDFHPEQALGFLPHQLDYTHLRMLWRRWRGKARNSVFGQAISPVGPEWIDRLLAKVLRLRGDIVPDFRLIDYLVCPMSTERSPSLDGVLSNQQRLLEDLDGLGVFDSRMALYQMFRQRTQRTAGYSGFEGRCYSLFPSYDDLRQATNLQALITALAYRYIAAGRATHADIPDRPFVESERRQIVFGAAIGIPTFFVESQGRNRFLLRLLEGAKGVRRSHRYPGRLRVEQREYQRLLLKTLRNDAQDIAEAMGVTDTLSDLERRLENPKEHAASEVLTRDILAAAGAKNPLSLDADEFNLAAERYYRRDLLQRHMSEGLDALDEAIVRVEKIAVLSPHVRETLQMALGPRSARHFLESVREDLLQGSLPSKQLQRVAWLMLAVEIALSGDAD